MDAIPSVHETCTEPGYVAIDNRRSKLRGCVAPDFLYLMAACEIAWPVKTAETLASITGASRRTAQYWLERRFAPRGPAAMRLLRAVRAQLENRLKALDLFGLNVGK